MKILFYNWVRFDDDENRGGGVTVYQRNIIEQLVGEGHEVLFFYSGIDYDFINKNVYYKRIEPSCSIDCTIYTIVNSPVFSPAHLMFNDLDIVCNDVVLKNIVDDLFQEIGGVDVIHFNNIEGLSLSVLELKHKYSRTKFIFSVHNYYIFCPQVNLWRKNKIRCTDHEDGYACLSCLPYTINLKYVLYANYIATFLKERGLGAKTKIFKYVFGAIKFSYFCVRFFKKFFKKTNIFITGYEKQKNESFNDCEILPTQPLIYIEKAKTYINKYVDSVLPVSKRVAEICIAKGIKSEKVITEYIGTKFAEAATYMPNPICGNLTFSYFGYMRKDKGFYFFLNALEKMPCSLARKVDIVVAAQNTDSLASKRLKCLKRKFNNMSIYDGYTHQTLPNLLSRTNVGIVPVLWEDNLPQVAIELYAGGCAVLASDLGGSSELSCSEYFKFHAGDTEDFINKFNYIVENPHLITDYFLKGIMLKSNSEHANRLLNIYSEG